MLPALPQDSQHVLAISNNGDAASPPIRSLATAPFRLPQGTVTFSNKVARELWAKNNIATAVLAQLNQPFGKDHLTQSFTVTAAFRHVLCPVIKSGFLNDRSCFVF
jgi:hypothetical protein